MSMDIYEVCGKVAWRYGYFSSSNIEAVEWGSRARKNAADKDWYDESFLDGLAHAKDIARADQWQRRDALNHKTIRAKFKAIREGFK